MYLSQVNAITPDIRLDLQDHIENIDFKWVTLVDLEGYMSRATTNLRKAYDELTVKDEILNETEVYQLKMQKKHKNMKKKLIGYGKNKHFGGGKGHKRPKMDRSKSAPPGFGAIGEQKNMIEEEKWPKKYFRIRKKR
tara:strand:- start:682 stop:1092 length:411 start_codon:yes stop_codon:yes gene_type:complete